jgi:hypothetical protein
MAIIPVPMAAECAGAGLFSIMTSTENFKIILRVRTMIVIIAS